MDSKHTFTKFLKVVVFLFTYILYTYRLKSKLAKINLLHKFSPGNIGDTIIC